MNRDAKRISNSLRPLIERIKGSIRQATRPFDGDGYAFKTALKELRQEGMKFKYVAAKAHYVRVAA
jgi:hypothetical protein